MWARYSYVAGIILSLLFLIPAPWFPLQLGKLALGASLILIAGIFFLIGGGLGGVQGTRGYAVSWLVALLPLSYALSYFISSDRSVGLFGYAIEADTLCFVSIAAAVFLVSSFLFRRLGSVRLLLGSVSLAALLALIFQFTSIFFGARLLPAVFSDPSVNLVGKWNDVGLVAGIFTMLLVLVLACEPMSLPKRIGVGCLALISILFLALVQFPAIWALLLGFSVILGLWLFIMRKKGAWLAVALAAVCILFLLWGATVAGGLAKVFPVSSFEVRPALGTTLDIVRASHGSSVKEFLTGTGPGTFGNSWFLYKPSTINQTEFWNLDFNVGYSTLTTALGTVGVLGAFAWCIPLILVLGGAVRVFRRRDVFNWYEQTTALGAAGASVYLWLAAFVYPPSTDMLLLACVLSGAAFAFSMKNDPQAQPRTPSILLHRAVVFSVIVLVAVLAVADMFVLRRYGTEVHVNQGTVALRSGDNAGALVEANAALAAERTGDSLQFATQAGIASLADIAQSTSTPTAQTQQQFASLAQTTVAAGQRAIQTNPNDYRAYLWLGRLYDVLAGVGVQGAYEQAKQSYASAQAHNPTNPGIPLSLARLESRQGHAEAAQSALKQALTLKSNYTDAILFAVQLYVANKDIDNAIVAAKAAVNSAPGVSSVWFELGLLYYSNNDMQDASAALEQAVTLQPDYANAKYFLGLSYAALGKMTEATQQFKELAVTNPGNSEVQLILSNLEAGKPPFAGATPPVTSTPEDRTTAPISQ